MRRTAAALEDFDAAIRAIAEQVQPATCRQLYYRAVVAGLVAKDDNGYRYVLQSLRQQRWSGALPWEWIADETRAVRKPATWADANRGLDAFAETYRRDAWRSQPAWVEAWVESDSLAGTLIDVTWDLGVPLFSGRGFSSLTSLRSAAEQIKNRIEERGQPTSILYIGDLDPSGVEASTSARKVLLRHLADLETDDRALMFRRLAVNPKDVRAYRLQTGGPPKTKGPGSVSWWAKGGPKLKYTVEAEAFEPGVLRELVRDAILENADRAALAREFRTEELERESLQAMARGWTR